jgi:hypothetical protein
MPKRYESPEAKKWLNMLKNGPTEGREEWLEKGLRELIEVVEYKHRQEYDLLMKADELSRRLEKIKEKYKRAYKCYDKLKDKEELRRKMVREERRSMYASNIGGFDTEESESDESYYSDSSCDYMSD